MAKQEALPGSLHLYLLSVGVAGPCVALAALWRHAPVEIGMALPAVMLTMLASVADRFQLQLTHKTQMNVATAAFVAMVAVLPPSLPGVLALIAVAAGHLARRADPTEFLFNSGQSALYVTVGAIVHAAVEPLAGPGALIAASAAMHLVNTGLVAIAAALQLGGRPGRIWSQTFAFDLPAQVVLTALGAAAAVLAAAAPLLLPVLALPVVLVRRAQAESVRLRAATHQALAALVEVVELRDPYTAGHSRRVAATARDLALRLGLTHEEADEIESAGRVHDVGKVAIDPAVLSKPGPLDAAEWAEMRRHPALGADVVARFGTHFAIVPLVRHHHEAWDGSGYPDGVQADAIPLGARILAVADAFDALTSDRPYRLGLSPDRALAILENGSGRQWDPTVVAAMIDRYEPSAVSRQPSAVSNQASAISRPRSVVNVRAPSLRDERTTVAGD